MNNSLPVIDLNGASVVTRVKLNVPTSQTHDLLPDELKKDWYLLKCLDGLNITRLTSTELEALRRLIAADLAELDYGEFSWLLDVQSDKPDNEPVIYNPICDKDRMIAILKSHGIEMKVGGCGCCGSPWVSFKYNGEVIVDDADNTDFDTNATPQNDTSPSTADEASD